MNIVDFKNVYLSDDWNEYLIGIKEIPTKQVGSGLYQFRINNEIIRFRSHAEKKLWSWRKVYWGYVTIYSTTRGKAQAPLLIEIADPNNNHFDNGYYLVIPKN